MIAHAAKSNRKSMQRLLRSILAPGTIGMRQLFFTKEIYFVMSKIRLFSVFVRCSRVSWPTRSASASCASWMFSGRANSSRIFDSRDTANSLNSSSFARNDPDAGNAIGEREKELRAITDKLLDALRLLALRYRLRKALEFQIEFLFPLTHSP